MFHEEIIEWGLEAAFLSNSSLVQSPAVHVLLKSTTFADIPCGKHTKSY